MARFIKNRSKTVGKAPGTLTFIGHKKMDRPRLRLISYDEETFFEGEFPTFQELFHHLDDTRKHWVNIDGIHDPDTISEICSRFNLSPLVQEDIMNTDQRPKMMEADEKIVIFLKMIEFNENQRKIESDQITLILGSNLVLTFQEDVGEHFNPIRERLRQSKGKLRGMSTDYLLYRLIDTIVDNYLVCISALGDLIEKNEEQILSKNDKTVTARIYHQKTEISFLRKVVRPVKDVAKLLKDSDIGLVSETTWPFLDDLDGLLTHAIETIETYYTMTSDQLMIYNTNLSNRANEVMKVLTMFASIFIPLTFIVGVYGTNFDNIPELHFKYGYFAMWGVMVIITVVILVYFRRKRWL
ncbi:MAG TPA: magnesium/cobalt transporter CorA [Prolixibacteraceae bacterium]|nr:magnesium/cobalt transporter CorA [Prolixibacteraceae bacterium]HPS11858.1 magnesium/cobalt transporter CorA [Prolixibacteraceae bacterium]